MELLRSALFGALDNSLEVVTLFVGGLRQSVFSGFRVDEGFGLLDLKP